MGPESEAMEAIMGIEETIGQARDAITVRRVFGDPYEKDGTTFVPAARVSGGGGGGEGEAPGGEGKGSGSGFGLRARPAGAYVIRNGEVTWKPAIDINRAIVGTQVVAVVFLLAVMSAIRRRR
jgi:uncharacterized spore protein YtfJ